MKNTIIVFSLLFLFISCKENVVNGFDSLSVKKDLTTKLNQSEWISSSQKAYYSKIFFDNQIIVLTRNDGVVERVNFNVTNVSVLTEVLPEVIQVRLRSGLPVDELYLKNDFSTLRSLVIIDNNDSFDKNVSYERIK